MIDVVVKADGTFSYSGEEGEVVNLSIIAEDPPNVGPLVELLRSDRPIPPGVRDMLAEMLDPKSAGYFFHRAYVKVDESKAHNTDRDSENIKLAKAFEDRRKTGISKEVAVMEVAESFDISSREVYRRVKDAAKLVSWLKGGERS